MKREEIIKNLTRLHIHLENFTALHEFTEPLYSALELLESSNNPPTTTVKEEANDKVWLEIMGTDEYKSILSGKDKILFRKGVYCALYKQPIIYKFTAKELAIDLFKENDILIDGLNNTPPWAIEKIIEFVLSKSSPKEEPTEPNTEEGLERFKEVFDKNFKKVTPEQFIKEMETLGYEFLEVTPTTNYLQKQGQQPEVTLTVSKGEDKIELVREYISDHLGIVPDDIMGAVRLNPSDLIKMLLEFAEQYSSKQIPSKDIENYCNICNSYGQTTTNGKRFVIKCKCSEAPK